MKIKNYRLFLSGFVTVSFIFLTGLQEAGVNNAPLPEKPAASVTVKSSQDFSKEIPNKSKLKKAINKHSVPSANEDAVLQKTLDLTIPFRASENAWLKTEQSRVASGESLTMFTSGKKKRPRSIDLNGQMLMSQEPEVDKQKSLDGAGIVFTLKR
jgi:hypothetical protein